MNKPTMKELRSVTEALIASHTGGTRYNEEAAMAFILATSPYVVIQLLDIADAAGFEFPGEDNE